MLQLFILQQYAIVGRVVNLQHYASVIYFRTVRKSNLPNKEVGDKLGGMHKNTVRDVYIRATQKKDLKKRWGRVFAYHPSETYIEKLPYSYYVRLM